MKWLFRQFQIAIRYLQLKKNDGNRAGVNILQKYKKKNHDERK